MNEYQALMTQRERSDTPRPTLHSGRGFLDRSKNIPVSTRPPWMVA